MRYPSVRFEQNLNDPFMKTILTVTILLLSKCVFPQAEGIILDRNTKEPIPYVNVWVEGAENGTTANGKGAFALDIDGGEVLVFSAVGFETTAVATDTLGKTILLAPAQINLDEVVIKPSSYSLEKVVGAFKKSKIDSWRVSRKTPGTIARYFEYRNAYADTPFLSKLRMVTKSHVKNARFMVKLYRPDETGAPGEYLHDQHIYGYANKRKQYTEIDLSDLNIVFPESGLFVSVEWLMIEENEYHYITDYIGLDSVYTKDAALMWTEPSIGILPAESMDFAWVILRGEWINLAGKIYREMEYGNSYHRAPAIELTLTNQ